MKLGNGILRLFFRGMLAFAPIILLWCYVVLVPMNYINGEMPNYIWNHKMVNTKHEKNYDVIILGDSMSNAGFIPEILSEKTLDLALGGQTPIEQYYVLKYYLEKNQAPKVCYIGFNDNHFVSAPFFFSNAVFTHSIRIHDLIDILHYAQIYNEQELANTDKYWAYELRAVHVALPSLIKARLWTRRTSNKEHYDNMTKHRGTYIARVVNEYTGEDSQKYEEFHINPIYDFYYQKLIQLCMDNRVKVHLIKMPSSDLVYLPTYSNQKNYYYHELKEYGLVFTQNWIQNGFRNTDFVDGHHLNNHGSYKFSRFIKSMYPADFIDTSPISRETIDGLTDYLQMENEPGFILRWMEKRNFAALFFFRHGAEAGKDPELAKAIEECGYGSAFAAPAVSSFGTQGFYAVGDHHAGSFSVADETFTLQEEGWDPIRVKDAEYSLSADFPETEKPQIIAKSDATDLSVVILNNYDHKVVAVKNFVYMHGRYVLMKDK